MNLKTSEARRKGAIELNATARAYKQHPGRLALTVLAPAEPSPRPSAAIRINLDQAIAARLIVEVRAAGYDKHRYYWVLPRTFS